VIVKKLKFTHNKTLFRSLALSANFLTGCHEPAEWDAILEGKPYQVSGLISGTFESNVNVLTPDSEEFCDPATGAVTFGPLLCRIYPLKKYV